MDVILVGKFSQTSSGEYWATWQYYYRDGSRVYDSRTEEIKELGQLGLAPLADALASRYANFVLPTVTISNRPNPPGLVTHQSPKMVPKCVTNPLPGDQNLPLP